MSQFETSAWLTILAVEAAFIVITRVILASYWTYSLEAELIRTPLRLLTVFIYWKFYRDMFRSRPLSIGTLAKQPAIGAVLLFLSVPILVGDLSYMTPITKLVYAATSFVVALKEEVAFRALIQNLLARRFGSLAAILITTTLFTAFHIGSIPLVLFAYGQVVLAGLILGIVYARTQNLWFVVWLHTFYDALWSLTPVLHVPLPYNVGLGVLVASLLLASKWAWPTLVAQQSVPMNEAAPNP